MSEPAFSLAPQGRSLLRILGLLLVIGGLALATQFYFGFDVSVDSGAGFGKPRVENIGKTAERQAGISYGTLLVIVGIAAMYAGREPAAPSPAAKD